jgi:hypothetical protein
VLVDNLTRAYIVEIKNVENNETISFTVNYVIGDELESNVSFNRIKVIAMNHHSDTRSGNNHNSIPPSSHTQNNAITNEATTSLQYKNLQKILLKSTTYSTTVINNTSKPNHPLFEYLYENKDKNKGWIRNVMKLVMHDEINNSHQLSKKESVAFATMNAMLLGFSSTAGRMKGNVSLLSHAFGVTHNTQQWIFSNFIERGFSGKRKERSDRDMSIFDCQKRMAVFTAYNIYKKKSRLHSGKHLKGYLK